MYLITRSLLVLSFFAVSITTIHTSDVQGVSYCDHDPMSPYVCQNCINDLNKESINCTCASPLLKGKPNPACPYHYGKYLNWLQDENPEEYYKRAYPQPTQQKPLYQAPAPSTSYPTSTASSFTTTSTSYQPTKGQSLSSSMPAKKSKPTKISSEELKGRIRESSSGKREKSEKRSAEKKSTSAPSSLRSSSEKRVQFGIVPEEIGEGPRVMRRGAKPAQQQYPSSSEEEKEDE